MEALNKNQVEELMEFLDPIRSNLAMLEWALKGFSWECVQSPAIREAYYIGTSEDGDEISVVQDGDFWVSVLNDGDTESRSKSIMDSVRGAVG